MDLVGPGSQVDLRVHDVLYQPHASSAVALSLTFSQAVSETPDAWIRSKFENPLVGVEVSFGNSQKQ